MIVIIEDKGEIRLKKIIIVVLLLIISIFTVYVFYMYPKPVATSSIEGIYIDSYGLNVYEDEQKYGIDLESVDIENIKKVSVNIRIKNESFIKPINNISLSFSNKANMSDDPNLFNINLSTDIDELNLPDFIIGKKISTDQVESLNLKPREEKIYTFCFLVNMNGYDNNAIIKELENIDLYMYGTCYKIIDFKKLYLLKRGPRLINKVGIKCAVTT